MQPLCYALRVRLKHENEKQVCGVAAEKLAALKAVFNHLCDVNQNRIRALPSEKVVYAVKIVDIQRNSAHRLMFPDNLLHVSFKLCAVGNLV